MLPKFNGHPDNEQSKWASPCSHSHTAKAPDFLKASHILLDQLYDAIWSVCIGQLRTDQMHLAPKLSSSDHHTQDLPRYAQAMLQRVSLD